MPPINPYQMFLVYKLFGEAVTAFVILMILSALYSSLIPFIVYYTAKNFSSESESRVSSLIASLFLPAAFAVTTFSGSSLYQLMVLVTFNFAIQSVRRPSYKNFILFGLSAGIMALLRSEFYLLGFILIGTAGFVVWKTKKQKHSIKYILASCTVMAALVAPWTFRNYTLFGRFIPIVDHPWHEIWRGNNVHASGSTYDASGNSVWENSDKYPNIIHALDKIPYDQNFDLRADSIFHDETIVFIKSYPEQFAELAAIKIFSLFTIDYHHTASRNPLYFIFMMFVIIPSVLGMIALFLRSRKSGDYDTVMLYLVFFFYYCVVIISTFILPRYQIYIFSALLPVTGIGCSRIGELIKGKRRSVSQ